MASPLGTVSGQLPKGLRKPGRRFAPNGGHRRHAFARGRILHAMDALRTSDTDTIEAALADFFSTEAERLGIAAAYLFGSVARGTAGSRSDVDVGVLYEGDPPSGFAGLGIPLAGDLERRLGRAVDVV